MKIWAWALLAFATSAGAAETAVDAIAAHKHLGVATCSNSVCHGASQVFKDSDILQNEFAIWQEFDPHAKTFAALSTPLPDCIPLPPPAGVFPRYVEAE